MKRALLLLLVPAAAHAGDDDAERRRRADKTMAATEATGTIVVDGVLDDATWASATWVDDLAQKEPAQDAAPTERTEVAIAFDDDALYVGARMHLTPGRELDAPLTRRDDTSGAERIIVSLDPARSKRTAYSFAVTAAGVRADWIHTDDSERARDSSWNPVWRAEVSVGADAWTAEMRIPWSQLRYPDDAVPVWAINLNRFVPSTREDDFWIVVPKDRTGWASYFGELRGLRVRPRLRLELLPYVSAGLGLRSAALVDPDDPFGERWSPTGNAGLDLKLGLGSSLTLDATINPDFGQVEADPAVVNLDAFEITYPERRPFFVEGAPIFSSQPRGYFYSRRIGAPPRLRPTADYVDDPDAARILGAAKLTGQPVARTTVGVIAAVTAPAHARFADAGGAIDEAVVAPLAGWGVVRLERELDGDASLAGVTVTGVARDTSDATIRDALPRGAISGGGDLRWRFHGGKDEVFVAAGGSAVGGDPDAIARLETSSTHYFQRPDADHVALHPDATSLAGWHADAVAQRRAGPWRFYAQAGAESPGLELNDLGVLSSADDLSASAGIERVVTEPSRWLHSWSIGFHDDEAWNFGGVHKPASTELYGAITLPSFVRIEAAVGVTRAGLSDDETRGGPLMEQGPSAEAELSIGSSGAGKLQWGWEGAAVVSDTEASGLDTGFRLQWQTRDRLRLELAPTLTMGTNRTQYVDQLDDRYLFATLELRQLSTVLRVQAALSPELTIDAYAQPFVSSGRYVGLGELAAPRSREPRRYDDVRRADGQLQVRDGADMFAIGDPDFTVLSLRSTVVLRWELRPGSVLYAVWQQARATGGNVARGLAPGVFSDVITAPGEHVVAVKLSWWFGL